MGFLEGKTAIITGAGFAALKDGSAGSIGYGIATAYAKEGANLVITGRNVKKLETAKEKLEAEYGIQVLCVAADVNAGADNQAGAERHRPGHREVRPHRRAGEQRPGLRFRRDAGRPHHRPVPTRPSTGSVRHLLLHAGVLSLPEGDHGPVINFASGAGLFGNFGQCAPRRRQGGHPWHEPRGRHRMGP